MVIDEYASDQTCSRTEASESILALSHTSSMTYTGIDRNVTHLSSSRSSSDHNIRVTPRYKRTQARNQHDHSESFSRTGRIPQRYALPHTGVTPDSNALRGLHEEGFLTPPSVLYPPGRRAPPPPCSDAVVEIRSHSQIFMQPGLSSSEHPSYPTKPPPPPPPPRSLYHSSHDVHSRSTSIPLVQISPLRHRSSPPPPPPLAPTFNGLSPSILDGRGLAKAERAKTTSITQQCYNGGGLTSPSPPGNHVVANLESPVIDSTFAQQHVTAMLPTHLSYASRTPSPASGLRNRSITQHAALYDSTVEQSGGGSASTATRTVPLLNTHRRRAHYGDAASSPSDRDHSVSPRDDSSSQHDEARRGGLTRTPSSVVLEACPCATSVSFHDESKQCAVPWSALHTPSVSSSSTAADDSYTWKDMEPAKSQVPVLLDEILSDLQDEADCASAMRSDMDRSLRHALRRLDSKRSLLQRVCESFQQRHKALVQKVCDGESITASDIDTAVGKMMETYRQHCSQRGSEKDELPSKTEAGRTSNRTQVPASRRCENEAPILPHNTENEVDDAFSMIHQRLHAIRERWANHHEVLASRIRGLLKTCEAQWVLERDECQRRLAHIADTMEQSLSLKMDRRIQEYRRLRIQTSRSWLSSTPVQRTLLPSVARLKGDIAPSNPKKESVGGTNCVPNRRTKTVPAKFSRTDWTPRTARPLLKKTALNVSSSKSLDSTRPASARRGAQVHVQKDTTSVEHSKSMRSHSANSKKSGVKNVKAIGPRSSSSNSATKTRRPIESIDSKVPQSGSTLPPSLLRCKRRCKQGPPQHAEKRVVERKIRNMLRVQSKIREGSGITS